MVFGFINNLLDNFKAEDFHLDPRMKVKTVQRDFKNNFGLSLRVYKGNQFADENLTINQLNKKTSADINSSQEDIVIKATLKVGQFEDLIKDTYGLKVQVADEFNRYLIKDSYTLGQAARREHLIDWLKERGYKGIEDFLEAHNCKTLAEYYEKH